jgi:hypothetical protein
MCGHNEGGFSELLFRCLVSFCEREPIFFRTAGIISQIHAVSQIVEKKLQRNSDAKI